MTLDLTPEDRAVLEVLDRLNRDGEIALLEADMVCEYAELLALVPYSLEPVTPRSEIWERIHGRIGADMPGKPSIVPHPPRKAPAPPTSTLVRFPRRSESAPATAPPPAPVPASRQAGGSTYAMAAVLAVCLVGLGYLTARTQYQQSTIEGLRSELTIADAHSTELDQVRDQYLMVTRTARRYYPMRPAAASPSDEPLYGRVWVCGQHQQWLLNVEGLHEAPPGHEYRFWFETEAGKVPGGVVQVQDGMAQLSAPSMPLGTIGFTMTLERAGTRPVEPRGKPLLLAGEARTLELGLEDLVLDASLSM